SKFKLLLIAGARPNFIKIASLIEEIGKYNSIKLVLVHTGQHYDHEMSKIFFDELKIPLPDYNLKVGSKSNVLQTATMMRRLEPIILKEKPNLVVVIGDVNSTLSGALAAVKLHIPIAHIESGLRSFDKMMQEEINRRLTDHVSDILFVTEPSGIKNLLSEGILKKNIYYVGNTIIDTLIKQKKRIEKENFVKNLDLKEKEYCLLTFHRAEAIYNKKLLKEFIAIIEEVQKSIKVVWPVHPGTKKTIKNFFPSLKIEKMENLIVLPPVSYLKMLNLIMFASFVMTDSGGVQEESSFLNIPCLTLRKNTERPITEEVGTNTVVGIKKEKILYEIGNILKGNGKKKKKINYWDGKASKRIVKAILKKFGQL
ncbi:MAG: UDP-N-acetylglucosamine 2-epimerase (non-hydrolyzing), partial [Candidatus Pacebacteria bacterium]|nr:UDP-N-acetylglucosamine 2-epimerase (non-hydrolyzing) [Candidatus Paceibacterota bacterium]